MIAQLFVDNSAPFYCKFCNSELEKKPFMFFSNWTSKAECQNCKAVFSPTLDARLAVVTRYFYLPFFVVACPVGVLIAKAKLVESEAFFTSSYSQIPVILFVALGWFWLLVGMPKLIRRHWNNCSFKWQEPKL